MRKMWWSLSFAIVAITALFLTACGDDSSNSTTKSDEEYESLADLPDCTRAKEGDVLSVQGKNYVCAFGEWLPEEPEFDSSSSEEPESSSSEEESSSSEEPESSSEEESSSSEEPDSPSDKSSSSEKSSSSMESSSENDNSEYDSVNNTLTDLRDSKVYATTTIEINDDERKVHYSEVWMAENLNYRYLQPTGTLDSSSFCFNNDPAYCSHYGRLYLWSAAIDSAGVWDENGSGCGLGKICQPTNPVRGVCPKGWHLPNVDEVKALFVAVDGNDTTYVRQNKAGIKLKDTLTHDESPYGWRNFGHFKGSGTDDYSFAALPAGRRESDRYSDSTNRYYNNETIAEFWTASEDVTTKYKQEYATKYTLRYDTDEAHTDYEEKDVGFSIRCVKNKE